MAPNKRILIVDDDPDFSAAIKSILASANYHVYLANNVAEGMQAIRKKRPDLILLDVMMTDKTEGFEFSRKFKDEEILKNIPVVIISGVSDQA